MIINERLFTRDGSFLILNYPDKKEIIDEVAFSVDEKTDRFAYCSLTDPFFMKAGNTDDAKSIPLETQFLAVRFKNGSFAVAIPLALDKYGCTLHGDGNGNIRLHAESGDRSVVATSFYAIFYEEGRDLYALIESFGKSIGEKFNVKLRKDKKLPDFAEYFGWCTWNAFYNDVTEQNVIDGCKAFKENGFVPRFLLLDDGWQSVVEKGNHRGNYQLSSFAPNEKFGGDLTELSRRLKGEFGIKHFMVWHAMGGYWGGADTDSAEMQKYSPVTDAAVVTEGMFKVNKRRSYNECFPFGLVGDFDGFYDDYHKLLKSEGVDGVKVDVQSIVASHGRGNGGRLAITDKMHKALEKSAETNFNGNLINCMAVGNEVLFHSNGSALTRTSGDYAPNNADTSFLHIYDNAAVSLFIGEMIYTDWDMFWSNEECGKYHAMARAISGGPVYVSDKLNDSNFDIIGHLTDSESRVFLCTETAKISADSLFDDIRAKKQPLVINNENRFNSVTGVFNPLASEEVEFDVIGGEGTVCRSFGGIEVLPGEKVTVVLPKNDADIITVAPIRNGIAVFGLVDKYNGGAAVIGENVTENGLEVMLSDGGEFGFYADGNVKVFAGDEEIEVERDEKGFCRGRIDGKGLKISIRL